MLFIITGDEFASFSPATRDEIMGNAKGSTSHSAISAPDDGTLAKLYEGIDMNEVSDLTPKQMREWMLNASDKTKLGLRLFAEKAVVTAQELIDVGVENLAHFQSRTTIRTRTITGDKSAFLLGWDDWRQAEENQGRYAVTPFTHQALRAYFKLD